MGEPRVYGLKNCDTCRKARRWLDAHGIDHRFVDYRAEPVDAATLQDWADGVGGWDQLVNRRSTSWRQLSDKDKQPGSDAAWVALLQAHPTLVKRPVLVHAGGVRVGFREADWQGALGVSP